MNRRGCASGGREAEEQKEETKARPIGRCNCSRRHHRVVTLKKWVQQWRIGLQKRRAAGHSALQSSPSSLPASGNNHNKINLNDQNRFETITKRRKRRRRRRQRRREIRFVASCVVRNGLSPISAAISTVFCSGGV